MHPSHGGTPAASPHVAPPPAAPYVPAYYPNYASTPWAQPSAPRPLPKKGLGAGCIVALVVLSLVFAIPVVLVVVGGVIVALSNAPARPPPEEPKKIDPLEYAWKYGYCASYDKERTYKSYPLKRDHGSAHRLAGRTLLLHLRLSSGQLGWNGVQEKIVERASILTERYFESVAKAEGRALEIESIVWNVPTTFSPAPVQLDAHDLMTPRGMDQYRDDARKAAEVGLGKRLEVVVREMATDHGFENVAFLIHAPLNTKARNFAFGALRTDRKDLAEAAFLFVPPTQDFGAFSVSVSHETLHLFGAYDLYRLSAVDPTEKKDIMNAYCTGFGQVTMGDSTRYAVGWTEVRPVRPYKFEDY